MANIVTVVEDLDDLLKDGSRGVNHHLNEIDQNSHDLARIYSTFDEPRRSRDTPYLVALHTQATPDEPDGQGNRDWTHRIDFFYRPQGGDKTDRRKDAAWTAQAVARTLMPKRTQIGELITDARKVEVAGASVMWGRDVDGRSELLILRAQIEAREFLP